MNTYYKICNILQEASFAVPEVGDTILVGKWRNSPAVVKGYGKDKNGQPVVKTSKGIYSLYKFRLQKLMKSKKEEPVKK